FEAGKQVLIAAFFDVRHSLAISFDDLEILIINPDLSLEITLTFFDRLRRNIEDVAINVIDLFFAEVFQIVFADVIAGQNKWLDFADILQILSIDAEGAWPLSKRAGGGVNNLPGALPRGIKKDD